MPSLSTAPAFGEDTSFDIFAGRLDKAETSRLSKALVSTVAHLHQLVREVRPTPAEWKKIVAFLTEVGHTSDDKRQEWVLLSDLLGVTALVEELNSRRPQGATPNTARGPFYRADAPRLPNGASISLDGVGERLNVRGKVLDLDGRPVSGATVETWQANDKGFYENQQPDLQPEFNLRGVFTSGSEGCFDYVTVKPAGYTVPDDGPAGQLLRAVGGALRRPAHLHFMISADGFETVTTHVFERAEAMLHEDPLFGVRPELIGDIKHETCKGGTTVWALDFTFVMVRAKPGRRAA
jgi:hydroxyquinol 1,2-dioxygenase